MKHLIKQINMSIFIVFILSIICSFLFIKTGADIQTKFYNEISIYTNSNYDFVIPSPGYEQISDLEKKDFILTVNPYYYTETNVTYNKKEILSNILMIDDISYLAISPFTKKRLIEGEENIPFTAIVDYYYAKLFNVKIGDSFKVNFGETSFEYKVSAIYENNTMYNDGVVLINWNEKDKQIVFDSTASNIRYSGAWLKSKNYNKCSDFLFKEYKPLGRLKDREDFDSNESYQIHLDMFNKTSFASEIIDNRMAEKQILSKYGNNEIKSIISFVVAALIPIVFSILYIIFSFINKGREFILKAISIDPKNKGKILTLNNFGILFFNITGVVVYIIFIFLYKLISFDFVKIQLFLNEFIFNIAVSCFCTFIMLIIYSVIYNKNFKSIKVNK